MLKTRLKEFILSLRIPTRLKILLRPWPKLRRLVNSWPRLIMVFLAAFVLFYYPLGALISEDIDTNTDYEIVKQGNKSATVDTMSSLIRREVYNKSWTPGLPFIFPAYMLDNMPSFQLGVMSGISNISKAFAKRLDKTTLEDERSPLQNAAELLQYPGTIWMFSPHNKLVPAPSSNSQYRRARKQLQNYNYMLGEGTALFTTSPQNLSYFLQAVKRDLQSSSGNLSAHIRENSTSFFDNQADNLFYYNQGKLYAYYLLLKALSYDYKEVILDHNIYQPWTSLLKNLENASHLSPLIVRNGELDSTLAPNHLATLGFLTSKAVLTLQNMITALNQPADGANK